MRGNVADGASAAWARSVAALCAIATVVAVLVALPALSPGAGAPGSVALAVLAFALAALARTGAWQVRPVHARGHVRPPGDAIPVVRAGRATDPVHSPRRPRAPGQV